MATNSAKECNICNEEYNEEERCPRSLPCSHCICSECLQNLISRNTKKCPFCLRNFQATSAKDVGINTSLLDLFKLLKEMEQRVSLPPSDKTAPLTKTVQLHHLKRQTEELANEFVVRYKTSEEDIDDAIKEHSDLQENLLKELQSVQDEVMAKMKEITTRTFKKVSYIESQKKILVNQKKSIENKRTKLEDAIRKLEASVKFKDAGSVIDEVEEVSSDSTKCLQKIEEFVAESRKKSQGIRKVTETAKVKLERILCILKSSVEEEEQLDLNVDLQLLAIEDKKHQLITIEGLRERSKPTMELVKQRKLIAMQDQGGKRRYAKISICEKNRVCLHHLQEQQIPSNAQLLEHGDLMNLVDTSSRLTFLELSNAKKEKLGRLYIRLEPDGKRAQQFSLLCSGELGPTYSGSKILGIWRKGDREKIKFGDYENREGQGGKELVPGSWKEKGEAYKRPCLVGTVCGFYSSTSNCYSAQFFICTSNNPNNLTSTYFGMVEEGLHVLQEAVSRYPDITEVIISDTGLVLPI